MGLKDVPGQQASSVWGPPFRPHYPHLRGSKAQPHLVWGGGAPPRPPAESAVKVRFGYTRPLFQARRGQVGCHPPQADSPQPLSASDATCFSALADALFGTPPGFSCASDRAEEPRRPQDGLPYIDDSPASSPHLSSKARGGRDAAEPSRAVSRGRRVGEGAAEGPVSLRPSSWIWVHGLRGWAWRVDAGVPGGRGRAWGSWGSVSAGRVHGGSGPGPSPSTLAPALAQGAAEMAYPLSGVFLQGPPRL